MSQLNESLVEDAALTWFGELGYCCLGAEALAPTLSHGERESYGEVVLVGRLREALRRLNPTLPEEAREDALRKVLRVATPSLVQTNRAFHRLLRDGIPVEFTQPEPSPGLRPPSPSGRGAGGERPLANWSPSLPPSPSGRGAGGERPVANWSHPTIRSLRPCQSHL